MEPKKELSSSSSLRRRWASVSLMRPDERSASIAICLPGMASRVKRAPTSAMRVAPLVITRKFTTTRIRNTTMPMTKSPDIRKLEKPAITMPAARTPSWPSARMSRVVAIDSARRIIVAISRTVGKAENSSGLSIHRATIRMRTASAMEKARPMSIRKVGIGRIRTPSIATTPMAKAMSRNPVGR